MASTQKEKRAYGAQLKRQNETKVKRALRELHLKKQGGKCFVCTKPLDFKRSVVLHKNGPANTEANTAAVHAGCVPH